MSVLLGRRTQRGSGVTLPPRRSCFWRFALEKGVTMPSKCEAGACGVSCPGGCLCLWHPPNPADCECECDPPTVMSGGAPEFLTFDTEVNFEAKDLRLVSLAKSVERWFPGRTAIPSASVDSQVTMQVENVRFDEVLQECGLIVMEDPQTYAE